MRGSSSPAGPTLQSLPLFMIFVLIFQAHLFFGVFFLTSCLCIYKHINLPTACIQFVFGYVNNWIQIYGSCLSHTFLFVMCEYHQGFGSSKKVPRVLFYYRGVANTKGAKVFQGFKYLIVNDKHRFAMI